MTEPSSDVVNKAFMGLPRAHAGILREFAQAGGVGRLTPRHRVLAGTPQRAMPGTPGDWLLLVRFGLIEGDGDHLQLTKAGRMASTVSKPAGTQ